MFTRTGPASAGSEQVRLIGLLYFTDWGLTNLRAGA